MEGFKVIGQVYGERDIMPQRAAQLARPLQCVVSVPRALNATKFSSYQHGQALGIQLL